MVTISDAEHILDKLSPQTLSLDAGRCVCVRNHNASCTKCQEICPTQAISKENNHLTIDKDRCRECGCCANVCPTQAIQTAALPLEHFASELQSLDARNALPPDLWICCQNYPLAHEALNHLIVLPCLAHLDEAHLLLCSYYGISLHLLSNECNLCKNKTALATIEKTQNSAQNLAALGNVFFVCIHKIETSKEESSFPFDEKSDGLSRRDFLSSASSSLKHIGFTVASTALDSQKSSSDIEETPAKRFASIPGIFDTFYPYRNMVLLNVLYRFLDQTFTALPLHMDTRFWGQITINDTCQNCGICAQVCPTGALVYTGESPELKLSFSLKSSVPKGPHHEFRCSDCIQCHLCEDVCPQHAITLQNTISPAKLFDLEPEHLGSESSQTS